MAIVVDTSCLIILSKIEKLQILKELFHEVMIPDAVSREFGGELPSFIHIHPAPVDKDFSRFASAFLDSGESEAIALAIKSEVEGIIIDEKKGRKVANALGLKVIGTLGVLALANRKGILDDLDTVIKDVKDKGFYISDKHVREIKNIAEKNISQPET
jgi:predicted nucleic acid-binding protein